MLNRLEGLPGEHRQIVTDAILLRWDDLRDALAAAAASITHAQLKDFDWQMKACLALEYCKSTHLACNVKMPSSRLYVLVIFAVGNV